MSDVTDPESIEHKPIIVPREASQLFGAYLRQELEESLVAIGKPRNERLVNFIYNLEHSKEVRLVGQDSRTDISFKFSEEKDEVPPTKSSFILDEHLTVLFIQAINDSVNNALFEIAGFDERISQEMAKVLDFSRNVKKEDAAKLKMSRDENGRIEIAPLS